MCLSHENELARCRADRYGLRTVEGIDRIHGYNRHLVRVEQACFDMRNHNHDEVFGALLNVLADAALRGDRDAERTGLDDLAARASYRPTREPLQLLIDNPDIAADAWKLVETGPADEPPVSQWWAQVVIALGRTEPDRAARRAAPFLAADKMRTRNDARRAIIALAETHPREAMAAVGTTILDSRH
ncbi:MAG: hypothetical protein ACR2GK_10025 [Gemmatimonadaceae bacterium]